MQHNGPRNKVARNPQHATCDVQRAMRRDVASAPLSMPMRRSVAASARKRAARGNKCNVATLQRCSVVRAMWKNDLSSLSIDASPFASADANFWNSSSFCDVETGKKTSQQTTPQQTTSRQTTTRQTTCGL
jgi:hypothetical protein